MTHPGHAAHFCEASFCSLRVWFGFFTFDTRCKNQMQRLASSCKILGRLTNDTGCTQSPSRNRLTVHGQVTRARGTNSILPGLWLQLKVALNDGQLGHQR